MTNDLSYVPVKGKGSIHAAGLARTRSEKHIANKCKGTSLMYYIFDSARHTSLGLDDAHDEGRRFGRQNALFDVAVRLLAKHFDRQALEVLIVASSCR